MTSIYLVTTVAVLASALAVVFLGKLYPASRPKVSDRSRAELKKEFHSWLQWQLLLFFVLMVPCALVCRDAVMFIAGLIPLDIPQAGYVLIPSRMYWLLPGGAAAVVPVAWLTDRVYERVLKERYADFELYESLFYKYDVRTAHRHLGAILAVFVCAAIWLSAHWYTYFMPDGIVLNALLRIEEERFSYTEILDIQTAPRFRAPAGNVVNERRYVIHFRNGRSWDSNTTIAEDAPMEDIIHYVSQHSGVRVDELRVLDF